MGLISLSTWNRNIKILVKFPENLLVKLPTDFWKWENVSFRKSVNAFILVRLWFLWIRATFFIYKRNFNSRCFRFFRVWNLWSIEKLIFEVKFQGNLSRLVSKWFLKVLNSSYSDPSLNSKILKIPKFNLTMASKNHW